MNDLDLPADFERWSRDGQADYVAAALSRAELVTAVATEAGIEIDPERQTPQIRLSMEEFGHVLAALRERADDDTETTTAATDGLLVRALDD